MATRTAQPSRSSGFEIGLRLFAIGALIGTVVLLLAPLVFLQVLGAIILSCGLAGAWLTALGLRLEHPERWSAIKTSLRNRFATSPRTSTR